MKRKILVNHVEPEDVSDDAIAGRVAAAINYLIKEKLIHERKKVLSEIRKANGQASHKLH